MTALEAHLDGGCVYAGHRVLDMISTSPHQRVPLLTGSPEDVSLAEALYAARRA